MGLIVRENTAPIANGETADGDEVEAEFNKLFNEINGKIENVNIRADADIAGTKLLDNSVPGAKMQADAITTAKMAAAAVPKGYVSTSTATETFTTSTNFVDMPGITAATMTPGAIGDLIMCDVMFTLKNTGDGLAFYGIGFNIDGAAATDATAVGLCSTKYQNSNIATKTYTWAVAATATTSMVIKPSYQLLDGTGGEAQFNTGNNVGSRTIEYTKVFRVQIIPTK